MKDEKENDIDFINKCYSLGGHDHFKVELFMNGPIERFYIVRHLPTDDISCVDAKTIHQMLGKS
jgi:hypothetical protein